MLGYRNVYIQAEVMSNKNYVYDGFYMIASIAYQYFRNVEPEVQ